MKENNLFVKCLCSAHLLEIQKDESEFNFSIWRLGGESPFGFKERLRWAWHILKTGKPWADSVMVCEDDAAKIAGFLNRNIETKAIKK
jgi:hypothetical protein